MKLIINEYQLKKIVNIISENKDKKNVLFIGDSLSSGRGYTWNYLLEARHPEWRVTHIVEGGRRTDWMLDNLERELKNNKYDLVFIWGGTNDMFSLVSIEKAISNLQKMADLTILNGGYPIIFAGYDVTSVMTDKKLAPTIYCDKPCMLKSRDKMIDFQRRLEQGIKGAKVIKRIDNPRIKAGDGVHIGGDGHNVIADYVDSNLNSTVYDIAKSESKSFLNFNWISTLKSLFSGGISKLFGSGGKKLTTKLLNDLESLKENVIQNNNILIEGKTLKYDTGLISYNQDVEPIQVSLQLLGYSLPNWGVDGKFGPETKRAVMDFQIENNLEPTGIVSPSVTSKIINKIKSNDISDKDFLGLKVDKTEKYTETDVDKKSEKQKSVSLIGKDFESFAVKLHGEKFLNRVKEIGRRFGLDYNIILATMYYESKMDPSAVNPYSKATGLIQFMPFTAKALNTTIGDLRGMSAMKQLDYVEKFYQLNSFLIPKVKSPEEGYLLVFYPYAIGKPDSYVLGSQESQYVVSKIRSQNAPFDTNSDGRITKGEILSMVRKKWGL